MFSLLSYPRQRFYRIYKYLDVPITFTFNEKPDYLDYNGLLRFFICSGLYGANFDGIGTSYAISNPGFPKTYVNKNTNELYFYFEYELSPTLNKCFKTGYTFFRNYRIYEENDKVDLSISSIYIGDNRTILNTDFEDGFVFKAVLRYRFNLPN